MENSQNIQKVTVEKIMANRNDPKSPFKTLLLRCERDKPASNAGGLTNFLLGGNNTEKLTALQVINQEVIDKLGIEVGSQLNDLMPDGNKIKLVVSEITESEFQALETTAQIPYGRDAKLNPTTGEYLVNEDGEFIRRAVLVTPLAENKQDAYMPHVGTASEGPSKAVKEDSTVNDVVEENELPA